MPIEKFGVKVMSIGFLVDEGAAVVWRGPMVMSALNQFLREVEWGELDVLVVDMPPGTGDAQLTMAQNVPLSGAVIVSTPQDLSLIDARRGIAMFRQVNVPLLGVVENMSYFLCPHCGGRTDIFAHGGARHEAETHGAPFLGEIPLDMTIRETSDGGAPIVVSAPDEPAGEGLSRGRRARARQPVRRRRAARRAAHRDRVEPSPGCRRGRSAARQALAGRVCAERARVTARRESSWPDTAPDATPTELRVRDGGRVLRVSYAGGMTVDIAADRLRAATPSADKSEAPAGVTIVGVEHDRQLRRALFLQRRPRHRPLHLEAAARAGGRARRRRLELHLDQIDARRRRVGQPTHTSASSGPLRANAYVPPVRSGIVSLPPAAGLRRGRANAVFSLSWLGGPIVHRGPPRRQARLALMVGEGGGSHSCGGHSAVHSRYSFSS